MFLFLFFQIGFTFKLKKRINCYNKQVNSFIKPLVNYGIRILKQINGKTFIQKQQIIRLNFKFEKGCRDS